METRRRQPIEYLDRRDMKHILDVLRGDFDLKPSLAMQIGYANRDLIRLTEEQYRVIDGLRENPRLLVSGGAGTGKTVLAAFSRHWRNGQGE